MKFFVLITVLFSLIACQPKKKEEDSVINVGGGTTGTTSGGGAFSVDSASQKFHWTHSTLTTRAGVEIVTPAYPAAGSPTINSSSMITTLAAPADPDLPNTIEFVTDAPISGAVSVINASATTRTQDVLLTSDATTCSSSMSLSCAVDGTNAKLLKLTNIDASTFTSSTTAFSLTVAGSALSVPMTQNKLTRAQNHNPNGSALQYEFRNILEATAGGDYVYFVGHVSISGSQYSALFRTNKTTFDSELVFNPNQSLVTGGQVKNLSYFNGALYFAARTTTAGNFDLLKYDATSGVVSRISSATTLLNPSLFTLYNNYLYFTASNASGYGRLYKMSTTGTIKQLTDICSTFSDVGYKILVSSIGLYVSLSDPANCTQNRVIVRLKADDSVITLAGYAPGMTDPTDDGLGSIATQGTNYYYSAGNSYYLYKDNNDGTRTPLISQNSAWYGTKPYPVKNFVTTTKGVFWKNEMWGTNDLWKFDFTDSKVYKVYAGSSPIFNGDTFKVGDSAYINSYPMGEYSRIRKFDDNNNLMQVTTLYSGGPDVLYEAALYNDDYYFQARNSTGYKIFKMTSDGQVIQVTNINSGGDDFPLASKFHATSSGFVIGDMLSQDNYIHFLQ